MSLQDTLHWLSVLHPRINIREPATLSNAMRPRCQSDEWINACNEVMNNCFCFHTMLEKSCVRLFPSSVSLLLTFFALWSKSYFSVILNSYYVKKWRTCNRSHSSPVHCTHFSGSLTVKNRSAVWNSGGLSRSIHEIKTLTWKYRRRNPDEFFSSQNWYQRILLAGGHVCHRVHATQMAWVGRNDRRIVWCSSMGSRSD